MTSERDRLSQAFYGDGPAPPPWATDCPVRFEVWLAFAERVTTVTIQDGAAALGITPTLLRERIKERRLYAIQHGNSWRVPVATLHAEGVEPPSDADRQSHLHDHERVDLIIDVGEDYGPQWLLKRLRGEADGPPLPSEAHPVAAGSFVAVRVTFAELLQIILPLTNLARKIRTAQELGPAQLRAALAGQSFYLSPDTSSLISPLVPPEQQHWEQTQQALREGEREAHLRWFLGILVAVGGHGPNGMESIAGLIETTNAARELIERPEMATTRVIDRRRSYPVLTVNLNRVASPAVNRSRTTVKADAAEQLFSVDCSALTWAVVDSGIDALHPAFNVRDQRGQVLQALDGSPLSRVTRTFDLTEARGTLAADIAPNELIDWPGAIPHVELQPPLPIPGPPSDPNNPPWFPPGNPHGTHVAGVLAADWPENTLQGICPTLRLFDVRVLKNDGQGDEFAIVAALQLIRHLNEQAGRMLIAGVNLSLSVPHDVANYSCGWTPVCVECDRLVRSGVVVVAAAGNAGFEDRTRTTGLTTGLGYNTSSISDPGNTDSIITVGATHRVNPHRHGVSYFSSRGPTADGRLKPDLLAPGEDIDAPVPGGGLQAMPGTSQAAAHVSGAAAMLMARYRELIGRPERIKEILCGTATTLGRERAFQGHGLVDVLRAMQSV